MAVLIDFLGVYDQAVIKPKTFIRDIFFGKHETHEYPKWEIEYRKGRQLVAPFVSELIPGTEVVKRSYASKYYSAPKVAPKRTFSANEIYFAKSAGETIYGGISPEEKKAKLIGESFAEFEEQISRREELMCIDMLFKGSVVVKGEGVEDKIEYGSIQEITPSTLWTQPNADIVGDIESVITLIGETTGQKIEHIVMDPVAARLFTQNEKIAKLLDIKNANFGQIDPKELASGAMFIGILAPYNIPIYSYQTQHSVLKDDGVTYDTKKMIPEGKVLFAPSNNVLHYGPAADIAKGVIVAERVPFEDEDTKLNTLEIRTESRPLPVPFDIDAIKVLKIK
ncbi:major capsid protein [Fusobacterium animalis]|jgi:phage major capsid protein E|uniref:major capsid protein n=1 Tax=Fusobacterium TaxID=848 RepID=UPI0003B89748|nr:major capsid protein [Fusobacterium nucleatum]ERT39737.1 hypothetical protein HMPREF1766_00096 [Fusobacterium nucleatum CTI-5]DAN57571.1 MAG TPA: major capsid protein [Caudoviricetes sp.]